MSKKPTSAKKPSSTDPKKSTTAPTIKINPHAFFLFEHDNGSTQEEIGTVIFELFEDKVPKTVTNFKSVYLGDKGKATTKPPVKESNIPSGINAVNRISRGFIIQGGDYINNNNNGNGNTSNHPHSSTKPFDDENFEMKHDPFVLTSPNYGPNSNTSQWAITLCKCPWLDGQHVVFGNVKEGFDVLKKIESFGSDCGKITVNGTLRIRERGLLSDQECLAKYYSTQTGDVAPHHQQ